MVRCERHVTARQREVRVAFRLATHCGTARMGCECEGEAERWRNANGAKRHGRAGRWVSGDVDSSKPEATTATDRHKQGKDTAPSSAPSPFSASLLRPRSAFSLSHYSLSLPRSPRCCVAPAPLPLSLSLCLHTAPLALLSPSAFLCITPAARWSHTSYGRDARVIHNPRRGTYVWRTLLRRDDLTLMPHCSCSHAPPAWPP